MTALTKENINPRQIPRRDTRARQRVDRLFVYVCLGTAFFSVVILVFLLFTLLVKGLPQLSWAFLSSAPSPDPSKAGIRPALLGTAWACFGCALFTLPLGVATAVFLEEFKPRSKLLRWFHGFVQLNIANLAGVPSVVYGIIGVSAFVTMFGALGSPAQPSFEIGTTYYDRFYPDPDSDVFLDVRVTGKRAPQTHVQEGMTALTSGGAKVDVNVIAADASLPEDTAVLRRTLRKDAKPDERRPKQSWYALQLPFGQSVLAGSLTLMLVVLPIVIIASQEALRAVPNSLREGALGLGATRWQVVRNVTLPAATPGIMTGAILSMSRAVGEAAPVLLIANAVYNRFAPANLMDQFSVMPVVIYNWAGRPGQAFEGIAAGGIIALLALLLCFNMGAVFIRYRFQKYQI